MGLTILYAVLQKGPFDREGEKHNRNEEKKINPRENNSGPYDKKILELIAEIHQKFKTENRITELKTLLENCLQYNPENRLDWEKFQAYAMNLNKEEKMVVQEEEIKMECKICDQKEIKIRKMEKIIDYKDKFIKILLERNSILVGLLEAERVKKEEAEKNLNEFLDNGKTQTIFENQEKPSENKIEKRKSDFNNDLYKIFENIKNNKNGEEEIKENKKKKSKEFQDNLLIDEKIEVIFEFYKN